MIDQFIRNNRIQQMLMGLGNQQSINPSTSLPPIMGNPVDSSQLTPPPMPFDENARMKELFTPETTMNNRFRGLIDQMPQREKPGFWRGLGSVIVGAGSNDPQSAMINSERFAQMPYYRKLEDWEAQIKPVQQAADNERADNTQRRMFAQSLVSQEARNRQLDLQAARDERNALIQQEREQRLLKEGEQRNDVANERIRLAQEALDKKLDEATKLNMQMANQVEIARVRGDIQTALANLRNELSKDLENTRQGNRLGLEETRQGNRLQLKTTSSASTTAANRPPNELEKMRAWRNKAEQFAQLKPEYRKWITVPPSSGLPVVKPVGGWGGPTAAQRKEMMDFIFGVDSSQAAPSTTANVPIRQKSPSTGKIRESLDGGKTWRIIN